MLNGYTLGDEKLSRERFANKYWMGGKEEYVYQFHTMDIADGESERQQLLINNDRALYKLINDIRQRNIRSDSYLELDKVEKKLTKHKKAIGCLIILQLLSFGIAISQCVISLTQRKK